MSDTLTQLVDVENHKVDLSDDHTGKATLYLVQYSTGAVTCDVHEMIDRYQGDDGTLQGVRVCLANGYCPPVGVDQIADTEWEITIGEEPGNQVVEYVCYTKPDRDEFTENNVFLVDAFEPAPAE